MASQVDLSSIASGEFPAVVFVNPAADGGRAGAHLPRIRNIFETHAVPAEFFLTKSAEELEAVARERMRIVKRPRLLLAMGAGTELFRAWQTLHLARIFCWASCQQEGEMILPLRWDCRRILLPPLKRFCAVGLAG